MSNYNQGRHNPGQSIPPHGAQPGGPGYSKGNQHVGPPFGQNRQGPPSNQGYHGGYNPGFGSNYNNQNYGYQRPDYQSGYNNYRSNNDNYPGKFGYRGGHQYKGPRDFRDSRDYRDQRDRRGDFRNRVTNPRDNAPRRDYNIRDGNVPPPRINQRDGSIIRSPTPSGGSMGMGKSPSTISSGPHSTRGPHQGQTGPLMRGSTQNIGSMQTQRGQHNLAPSKSFQGTPSSQTVSNENQVSNNVFNPHVFDDKLLELFKPNPPLPVLPPLEKHSDEIADHIQQSPVADFVALFDNYRPIFNESKKEYVPPLFRFQREAEKWNKKLFQREKELRENMAKWFQKLHVPLPNKTKEPYHTLFVSGFGYDITEDRLRKEFETFGPIKQVIIVRDGEGKSRGYGFIEFVNKDNMIQAFQFSSGKVIDGRQVILDVERGRTVEGWRPRRLGGGMGLSRPPLPKKSERMMSYRNTGRPNRGGFRRGGFGRSSPPMKRRRF